MCQHVGYLRRARTFRATLHAVHIRQGGRTQRQNDSHRCAFHVYGALIVRSFIYGPNKTLLAREMQRKTGTVFTAYICMVFLKDGQTALEKRVWVFSWPPPPQLTQLGR